MYQIYKCIPFASHCLGSKSPWAQFGNSSLWPVCLFVMWLSNDNHLALFSGPLSPLVAATQYI